METTDCLPVKDCLGQAITARQVQCRSFRCFSEGKAEIFCNFHPWLDQKMVKMWYIIYFQSEKGMLLRAPLLEDLYYALQIMVVWYIKVIQIA